MTIGAVILAAGASTRLGSPKQVVPYKGSTLLQHTVTATLLSACRTIVVVTGTNADLSRREFAGHAVHEVFNPESHTGIASSIRVGLQKLVRLDPDTSAVVLIVCDQPFLNAPIIDSLISAHMAAAQPIVASQYADTVGVPALFARSMFPELVSLTGDHGAKKIIERHAFEAAFISFPGGEIDIDAPDDLRSIEATT